MASFKDCEGRVWDVRITVTSLRRVISLADADLLTIVEGKLIERLISDPYLLCDVLYAVCKPQADVLGVSDEAFGEALAGDPIADATTALLEGIVDFFQNSRDRAALRRVLAATKKAQEGARSLVEKRLASGTLERVIDVELARAEKEADEDLAELLGAAGESSGSVPALSE